MSEAVAVSPPESAISTESTPEASAAPISDEQLKGYALFLEKLKDPEASQLVARVKQFVTKFPLNLKRDIASERLHQFISLLEDEVPKMAIFADGAADGYSNAKEGLEKLILKPLHQHFFSIDAADKILDEKLRSKIDRISSLISLHKHLHGPRELTDETVLELAVQEFQRIDAYRAPRDKMQCILNGFRVIRHALDTVIGASAWGADQLLPVCIYTMIKANPTFLNSNVNFIASFRHPSRLRGEDEYLLMQMNIAIRDIMEIDELLLKQVGDLTFQDLSRMLKKYKKMVSRLMEQFPEISSEYADLESREWTVGSVSEFIESYSKVVEEFNKRIS